MSIEIHCQAILRELKSDRKYTRREIEFLLKFFTEIKQVTERMLEKKGDDSL